MYTQKGQKRINKHHGHEAGCKPALMTVGVEKKDKKGERGESK